MPPQIHAEPREGFQIGLDRKPTHKHDIESQQQSPPRHPFVRMMGQAGGISERWPGFTARRLDVHHLSPLGPRGLEPRSGFVRWWGSVPGVPLRGTPGYPLTPLRGRWAGYWAVFLLVRRISIVTSRD